ncbi:MAG TPA: Lrp/AsnC family transcriptional regulator, partial [Rhizobiales bacterium]|nr:Lrp/AsnC family transcriptional regulator [Hyphomicrobiales bacterium]
MSKIQRRLIDAWQRDFPLLRDPYAHMAFELGVSELYLLGMIKQLIRENILSRVGAVVAPNTAGASVLAAIAAPAGRLEEVAAVVNAEPGVNHNYEREHRYNLWFVVTGRDRRAVDAAIARIQDATGLDVLTLPLRTAYHIDLGFPLDGSSIPKDRNGGAARSLRDAGPVSRDDRALLRAIEDGLPVAPRPFEQVGHAIGSEEDDVIARLGGLIDRGIIKRFGLVVRHRELGYSANA